MSQHLLLFRPHAGPWVVAFHFSNKSSLIKIIRHRKSDCTKRQDCVHISFPNRSQAHAFWAVFSKIGLNLVGYITCKKSQPLRNPSRGKRRTYRPARFWSRRKNSKLNKDIGCKWKLDFYPRNLIIEP